MASLLESPIEYLKGVGPQRAELLKSELGVYTFNDLLYYFPFRYIDRGRFYTISEVDADAAFIQIKGVFTSIRPIGAKRAMRLVGNFRDETGEIEVVWFKGVTWVRNSVMLNKPYVLFGKPTPYKGRFNMVHPEMEPLESFQKPLKGKLQGVYSITEKLRARKIDSRTIGKLIETLLPIALTAVDDVIPEAIRKRNHLLDRKTAVQHIHSPANPDLLQKAQITLKFEELLFLQMRLVRMRLYRGMKYKGLVFESVGEHFNMFYQNHLPFDLTDAQKRVIKEIRQDMGTGRQMNRLLQGDVGSGKTMVALLCSLIAIDNGFQVAIMAPTEILAQQHFESFAGLLSEMPVDVALLTGSTTASRRKEIHANLLNGQTHIIIGTHALLEDKVQFHNLGFVVIDEQHRFGVAQRSRLWKKNGVPPHVLVMTATPIPRTLAMTVYGDLDVSVIDELPPGRKPIKTLHKFDGHRLEVFGFLKKEIAKGRQVYVVYPLIQESEKLDYKDLMDGYESIVRAFPRPQYEVCIVHGQMKPVDKDYEMKRFAEGKAHIMVATTVIEVGVNVPNASVMVIESAERFGLSQLHQLRGRVGRGADQSFCILMTGHKLSNEARQRMQTMCETNDGLRIAEVDLKLRGPGDLMGTQQSGLLNLKIADLIKDSQLLHLARTEAETMLDGDPNLEQPENLPARFHLAQIMKKSPNWSKVS